jgi:low temperature requirement protein LtrA
LSEHHHSYLRRRDGQHARVTYEELLFDLVYVFAVTQVSHELLEHLSLGGLLETVILWFAVWLGWQYTCWFTNWFDPETPLIRTVLFASMLLALVLAAAIPDAFGERGLIFALAYIGMQVGRTTFVVFLLGRGHVLHPNYRRMAGWLTISAIFWIAGAFLRDEWRVALWSVAVLCEYASPMIGFALPGLGRSRTSEWTIEGAHLAERCQLFVIVALGETLLMTGATMAKAPSWNASILLALLAAFLGTLAMWWLYFGTAGRDAIATITRSSDPGRIGAYFHYAHAILVAGIVATAVGNDLVLAHPHGAPAVADILVLCAGPAIYLLGSAIYKKIVYGMVPVSHIAGALGLAAIVPVAFALDLLEIGLVTTALMLAVCVWEDSALRRRQKRTKLHYQEGA